MKLLIVTTLVLCTVALSHAVFNSLLTPKFMKMMALKMIYNNMADDCATDLEKMVTDAINMKFWAIKMLDATGKILPGAFEGNLHLVGDYDLCLGISEKVNKRKVEGKYCTAFININDGLLGPLSSNFKITRLFRNLKMIDLGFLKIDPNNVTIPLGVCMPKSCSVEDFNNLLSVVEKRFRLPLTTNFVQDFCFYKNQPVDVSLLDMFVYLFFIILLVIVAGSTIYDIVYKPSEEEANALVLFSIYSNIKKLRQLSSVTDNSDLLGCLDGIKVLSCAWIVLSHIVILNIGASKNALHVFTEWTYQTKNMFLLSGFYAVDTFLAISGLLTTYHYLRKTASRETNILSYYFFRWLRFFPALLGTVFVHMSILKLMADGPYGPAFIKFMTSHCYYTWWKTLFFVNNFFDSSEMCGQQTWYLSIEAQLFLCTIIILMFINKYTKEVLIALLSLCLIGILYSCLVTANNKFGFVFYDINKATFDYLHIATLHHLPSWIIGVFFGYLIYRYNEVKISKTINTVCWIISLYTMYKLIVNQTTIIQTDYSTFRSLLWNGFAKPTWCLAVCFIAFSCAKGQGGFANAFLSHWVFKELSRLTYCIYLINLPVLFILIANMKETFYFNNFQIMSRFIGMYIIVVKFALLLYLGFEAPAISLKEHLIKKQKGVDTKVT